MKKMILVLAVVIVLFSAAVLAEDLSDPFRFATFGEAVEAANETAEEGDSPYGSDSKGYCVALIERDGRFFRSVAFLDDYGKELYAAYLDASEKAGKMAMEEYRTLDAYLMTLPVQYTEELTILPLPQEELDAMAGKTLGDVMLLPRGMQLCDYPDDAEAGKDIVFRMMKGFCEYDLVIDEPAEVYQKLRAADRSDPYTDMSLNNYLGLTVREVKYARPSRNVLNLDYLADGTLKQDAGLLFNGD